jgi:hypothetical protein
MPPRPLTHLPTSPDQYRNGPYVLGLQNQHSKPRKASIPGHFASSYPQENSIATSPGHHGGESGYIQNATPGYGLGQTFGLESAQQTLLGSAVATVSGASSRQVSVPGEVAEGENEEDERGVDWRRPISKDQLSQDDTKSVPSTPYANRGLCRTSTQSRGSNNPVAITTTASSELAPHNPTSNQFSNRKVDGDHQQSPKEGEKNDRPVPDRQRVSSVSNVKRKSSSNGRGWQKLSQGGIHGPIHRYQAHQPPCPNEDRAKQIWQYEPCNCMNCNKRNQSVHVGFKRDVYLTQHELQPIIRDRMSEYGVIQWIRFSVGERGAFVRYVVFHESFGFSVSPTQSLVTDGLFILVRVR